MLSPFFSFFLSSSFLLGHTSPIFPRIRKSLSSVAVVANDKCHNGKARGSLVGGWR